MNKLGGSPHATIGQQGQQVQPHPEAPTKQIKSTMSMNAWARLTRRQIDPTRLNQPQCLPGSFTREEIEDLESSGEKIEYITPLHRAIINGDNTLLIDLIDGNVDVNGLCGNNWSPLKLAHTVYQNSGHLKKERLLYNIQLLLEADAKPEDFLIDWILKGKDVPVILLFIEKGKLGIERVKQHESFCSEEGSREFERVVQAAEGCLPP